MSLHYKINILDALKEKGYTTYSMRKNKTMGESTIQKLRDGKGLAWEGIETLCKLLECQPSDFLEYTSDQSKEN